MAARSRVSRMRRTRIFLNRLPKEMTADLRREMESAGDFMLEVARREAPVETGTLRDALSVRRSSDRLTAEVGVIRKKAKERAWYAPLVEFGTKETPANPFMGRTAEITRPILLARVGASLRRTLIRASKLGVSGD